MGHPVIIGSRSIVKSLRKNQISLELEIKLPSCDLIGPSCDVKFAEFEIKFPPYDFKFAEFEIKLPPYGMQIMGNIEQDRAHSVFYSRANNQILSSNFAFNKELLISRNQNQSQPHMKGVNKVILVGNLGDEPEIKNLDNNVKVVKFSLATNETYKDHTGQSHTHTDWHSIVLWRGLAELAEKYLHKGSMIYLEGKIKTRNYEDKQGEKRYVTEIIGENVVLLDKPKH